MPKRQAHHRRGKLIQKNQIDTHDVRERNAEEGRFRVIATEQKANKAWIVGDYVTFREAIQVVDNMPISDIDYYVHTDSSRVIYQKNRRDS